MSHDQRPGKLRVVQDDTPARRSGDPVTIDGRAELMSATASASADPASGASAASAQGGSPLVKAGLFLLACVAGGVVVAILRPFGIG